MSCEGALLLEKWCAEEVAQEVADPQRHSQGYPSLQAAATTAGWSPWLGLGWGAFGVLPMQWVWVGTAQWGQMGHNATSFPAANLQLFGGG